MSWKKNLTAGWNYQNTPKKEKPTQAIGLS